MTTYVFPNLRPQTQRWQFVDLTAVHRDPFKGTISTSNRDGEHWRIQCNYTNLAGARRRQLIAFLLKLNGAQHRFRMRDWSYVRAGVGGGSPLVNGAAQAGKSLIVDGAPPSTTGWLLEGDKIGVGDFLHSVDEDVDVDAGGNATIIVTPRIFISPNDDDAVEIDEPTNLFVLDQPSLDIDSSANVSNVSFNAVTAFTP